MPLRYARILFDKDRVRWSVAEHRCAGWIFLHALNGRDYPIERGVFAVDLFDELLDDFGEGSIDYSQEAELRQAIIQFDPRQVARWSASDAEAIAARIKLALVEGSAQTIPGIISVSLHAGKVEISATYRPKAGINGQFAAT